MKLFYSPGACSLAPHVALHEIGVPFELVEINIANKMNSTPEFLQINPRGRVPVLEVGGERLTEAPALLVYIASLNPQAGLLPPSASTEFARCLEWLNWFTSSVHIAYAQIWRPERFLPPGMDSALFTEQGKQIVRHLYAEVEVRLVGPWLLGDHYSIADVFALPFYRWGNRIGLAMGEENPRWAEWSGRMIERPAVRAAIEREGIGFELFRR